jgi:protein gp37
MKPEWVREIREQCKEAEVAFFFKQWGGARKDIAGRKLDGRTWNAMPQRLSNKKAPTKKGLSELVPLSAWS